MAELISTTTTSGMKAGAMVASGSIMADLTIFQDGTYIYLSSIGALISSFGAYYELQFHYRDKKLAKETIIAEVGKGLLLGLIAIPFWYLFLTTVGDSILKYILMVITHDSEITKPGLSKDIWMLVTVPLAWKTVPIIDSTTHISKKIFSIFLFKKGKD